MKMYINTLTKEKRKSLVEKFLSTEQSIIYYKANRIMILGLIGIIISIGTTVFDILYKTGTLNYILDGLLFVFSAYFVYKTSIIKLNELNKYALSEKNKPIKKSTKSKK